MRLHLFALMEIVVKEDETVDADIERFRRRKKVSRLRLPVDSDKCEIGKVKRHIRTGEHLLHGRFPSAWRIVFAQQRKHHAL